jgi:hypothetical protein
MRESLAEAIEVARRELLAQLFLEPRELEVERWAERPAEPGTLAADLPFDGSRIVAREFGAHQPTEAIHGAGVLRPRRHSGARPIAARGQEEGGEQATDDGETEKPHPAVSPRGSRDATAGEPGPARAIVRPHL